MSIAGTVTAEQRKALAELRRIHRQITPTKAKLDGLLDRRLALFQQLRELGVRHQTIASAAGCEPEAVIQALRRGRKGVTR